MTQGAPRPNLFHYLEYRLFLRHWFAAAKRRNRRFSHRAFAKRAGFRSPTFFKLVMDGQRNLTEESLVKCMHGVQLNKQEQEFFRNLVFFNQAKTHEDKDGYYRRLLRSRKYGVLKPIERQRYAFYSTWYHPVIRELIAAPTFDGTPAWLARMVSPSITGAEVEKSLTLLEQLGLIRKDAQGRWQQAEALVTTGPEVVSHVVVNYHRSLLDVGKSALAMIEAGERDISALTLGMPVSRIPQLKEKIRTFRREILEMVADEAPTETVVQLNIQMFPVTKRGVV